MANNQDYFTSYYGEVFDVSALLRGFRDSHPATYRIWKHINVLQTRIMRPYNVALGGLVWPIVQPFLHGFNAPLCVEICPPVPKIVIPSPRGREGMAILGTSGCIIRFLGPSSAVVWHTHQYPAIEYFDPQYLHGYLAHQDATYIAGKLLKAAFQRGIERKYTSATSSGAPTPSSYPSPH
ncbi:hypothetical protein LXA43DRAFT_1064838 [Ganoderma leucocontextum]|nr:hypothetical protein LXA43DRAFT_1064838 [Ganoderma leucocontextum]